MRTIELSRYLTDEDAAEEYLRRKNVLVTFNECPSCGLGHLGRIRRGRYKCYECKYEWNIRKGSKLESTHMALSSFIGMLKMFADGMTATQCAYELNVSTKLTTRIFNTFRDLITGSIPSIKETNKLLLHISRKKDQIAASLIPLQIDEKSQIKFIRSKNSDGDYYFIFKHSNTSAKGIMKRINRINQIDNFYNFASERIRLFRGRNLSGLFSAFLEIVFRYNNRHQNIYKLLIEKYSHS